MAIGSNPHVHAGLRACWEAGYREALLDVYVFLTANEQTYELDHLEAVEKMINAVNEHERGRLNAVVIG